MMHGIAGRIWRITLAAGLFLAAGTAHAAEGQLLDQERTLLYVPADLDPAKGKHPIIIALSPGGRPYDMIQAWRAAADAHGWFVLASKEFHNGTDADPILGALMQDVKALAKTQPIDVAKVIAAGFSGGAMGAHMLAAAYPWQVVAVVANCGVISDGDRAKDDRYPWSKKVVFLASPGDMNYARMQEDERWLTRRAWTTDWIEFEGGHVIAPAAVYDAAAEWLASNL